MNDLELEAMIQRAAEAGAKKALRDVGLQDDDAVHDMREIRDLLDSQRSDKRAVSGNHVLAKFIPASNIGFNTRRNYIALIMIVYVVLMILSVL